MAQELDGVRCHPVDVDTCKCTLSWWCIHEHRYPMVGMLAQQSLGFQQAKSRQSGFSPLSKSSLHFGGVVCKLTT